MIALFLGLILLAVGTAEYLADRARARRRQRALDSFHKDPHEND
jgi:hypothetical protein